MSIACERIAGPRLIFLRTLRARSRPTLVHDAAGEALAGAFWHCDPFVLVVVGLRLLRARMHGVRAIVLAGLRNAIAALTLDRSLAVMAHAHRDGRDHGA